MSPTSYQTAPSRDNKVAEEKGFEPLRRLRDLLVFKTSPFNHLGNSPLVDQADHDTATIRLWAEGSSFELLVQII